LTLHTLAAVVLLYHQGTTQDSIAHNSSRKIILASSMTALGTASLISLNELWYADYPRSPLHSFNDNREWLQMDKVGHSFTCYQLSFAGYDAFKWAGFNENTSLYAGSSAGLLFMTGIEIMDGRSAEWGFSWGDMAANIAGTSLFIGQQKIWNEQRMQIKFSYSQSEFAKWNPSILGRNFQQRLFKDYNAQTYWCSANVSRFLADDAAFPKWLNVAIGYGATGMTRGEMNDYDVNNFRRAREYYVSFDADLNQVKWPKKWMKITARVLSFIKLPAPALEVQSDGKVKLYALFF